MKLAIEKKKEFPEVDVVGGVRQGLYWRESVCCDLERSLKRKEPGPVLITTDEVDAGYVSCVNYGDIIIHAGADVITVRPLDRVEIFVELPDGTRSVVGFVVDDGVYESLRGTEYGEREIFFRCDADESYGNSKLFDQIRDGANTISSAHPECLGRWRLVDKDCKGVMLREYRISADVQKSVDTIGL